MKNTKNPSAILLTRQKLPKLNISEKEIEEGVSKGAYILHKEDNPDAILFTTGSEAHLAVEICSLINKKIQIINLPCWELFEKQDIKYQKKVLTSNCLVVGIEAASPMGWDKWLHAGWRKNKNNFFVGMNDFGASAPAGDLYEHFGITEENVINKVKENFN